MNAIVPHRDFTSLHYPTTWPKPVSSNRRHSFLRRFYDAIVRGEQRRADRELARFFGGRLGEDGLRLTDDLERRLAEHFTPKGGFQP